MGEVYRADDLKLGESVALELLSPNLAHAPDFTSGNLDADDGPKILAGRRRLG